jgi:hypothetical protein
MTDDERDQRIDTLTDAIADTNRTVRALAVSVGALTADVQALTADVGGLTSGVGQLAGAIRTTNDGVASLTRLVHLHLHLDHDYPDLGDES